MSQVLKNTAGQGVNAVLVDSSDGSAITSGASITLSLDGGASQAGAGTLSHIGNGLWDYEFTQAETNADRIGFVFSGTNVTPTGGVIYTATKLVSDLNDLAQSDILSDATPFAGANVDATVSSRSTFDAASDNVTLAAVTHTGATVPTVTDVTNGVTVSTNNDKTAYSLSSSQSFDNSGQTTNLPSNLEAIKGTSLPAEGTAGNFASSFGTWFDESAPANSVNSAPLGTAMRGTDNASTHDDPDPNGYIANLNGHTAQSGDTFAQLPTNFSASNITATGNYGIDLANVENQSTIIDLSNTSINDVDTVNNGVTVSTNNDKTGYGLTSSERDSIANALLDLADAIETGYTLRESQRLMLSALAAKLSGAGGNTVTIRDVNDTKDRIIASVDSNGNRTSVTLDET